MCACACVCVYSCIFLDADKREALVKKNVFLARKQQLFANWPFFFCQDNKEKQKYATFKTLNWRNHLHL